MERPLCDCHGEPMHKGGVRNGRQQWRCTVKGLESCRVWRENNRDKKREINARRMFACGMYLGSFGFTDKERREMLHGSSD